LVSEDAVFRDAAQWIIFRRGALSA